MNAIAKRKLTASDDSFNTPENVLTVVRAFAPIALDPCSNPHSIVGAKVEWSLENGDDGLTGDWSVDGLTFFNPGYSFGTQAKWVAKAAWERTCNPDGESIGLLQARTDTAWFERIHNTANAICYWRGRIRFHGQDGPGKFASVLAYWGNRPYRFADVFQDCGKVFVLR